MIGSTMVRRRRHLRNNDVALIGIVLLACGIAVLAAGPRVPARLLFAGALWASAGVMFAAARHPGRRR
jgi:membrane associated rhomboid family serine protease